jgi:hypothetical protein
MFVERAADSRRPEGWRSVKPATPWDTLSEYRVEEFASDTRAVPRGARV